MLIVRIADRGIHELHIPRILCAQGRVNHVTHPRLWSEEEPRMSHVVYPTLCAKDPGNVQLVNDLPGDPTILSTSVEFLGHVISGTSVGEVHDHVEVRGGLENRLPLVFKLAQDKTLQQQCKQKDIYDKKVHGKSCEIGDTVFVLNKYKGPFEVVRRIGDAYEVCSKRGRHSRR
ncbi:hypothetical protein Bbelb_112260 [Branchiostoma belcheri]|nr:hypothetical protein Bbelb_112260 [Branchiostoma belcheri]